MVKLKNSETKLLTKNGKKYYWCSQDSGDPTGVVCDHWMCHTPNTCKGITKKSRRPPPGEI